MIQSGRWLGGILRVKIHQHSITMQNLVIFILLSVFFIHSLQSLAAGVSAFNLLDLKQLIISKLFLATLMFATIFLIVQMRKISLWPLLLFLFLVSWECFSCYFVSGDKLILSLSFIYLMFSIFFFLFWYHELGNAVYNPGYSFREVGGISKFIIPVQFSRESGEDPVISGMLTNWGPESCFVTVNEDHRSESFLLREMQLKFAGETFRCRVELISSYFRGFGLKILPDSEKNLSCHDWQEFYRILSDRGYQSLIQRKLR